MSTTSQKRDDLYGSLGRIAKALANGKRLQLLEFVAQAERSVEVLAKMTGMTVANASQHLQALRQAGLVIPRKEGLRVYYRVAGNDVIELHGMLRDVGESRLAEVRQLVR